MVKVKLLGPLKTLLGKDTLIFDEEMSLSSLMKNLEGFMDRRDFLVLVNGIEMSVIGEDKWLKKDDEVVLVPVVHGG
ncbi:hypothetical protein HRbin06_00319 [archaeon HR06]|nr:hypothetical protein HRbin06_00319 [archaeon HR06]